MPSVTFKTTAAVVTTVQVADFSFTPDAITVPLGTTVTWQWQGTTSTHNVTFTGAGAPPNIGNMTTGSAQRTFNTPGIINYSCTFHPSSMTGSVTVN